MTTNKPSTAKKFVTKDGGRNKAMLNRVVKMREQQNASWRTIGEALDVSPRTALRMYDEVRGKGAHHGLLPGKGGRVSPIAKADIGGSGARFGVDPEEMAALAAERKAARAERRADRKAAAEAEATKATKASKAKAKAKG